MRYLIVFFCLFMGCWWGIAANAQNMTLSGYIEDMETGERLTGVSVQELTTSRYVQTNNFGFFSFECPKNNQIIRVHYAGYRIDTVAFKSMKDTLIRLSLTAEVLKEVVIRAKNPLNEQQIGVVNLPVQELKSRPVLLGEPDIIKALSLTPGVKTGTEGTTGLYIRGGTPDQNLILLDGATVYNNSHLFGFVSVFNPDAIHAVTLYKGQMPARYGGRLSSVLDVVMKEGNNQKKSTEFSIGLISSRFLTEGPLKKGRSSYLFSARSSYLGILALPNKIAYNNASNATYANYWMYDLNGKINMDLGKTSRLYLSYYQGHDNWNTQSKENSGRSTFGLRWGNQTASVRYNRLLSGQFFWISQATFNRYRYVTDQNFSPVQNTADVFRSLNTSFVQDIQYKNTLQWAFSARHLLETGIELTQQRLHPNDITLTDGKPPLLPDSLLSVASQGLVSALFLEDKIALTPGIGLTLGIRGATFSTGGRLYRFLEPRTNLSFRLSALTHAELSWRINYQPIHLLTSSGAGLPNDIWVPATATTPPGRSQQWSAGISHTLPRISTVFSIEAYYKKMDHLLDFRQGLNFINTEDTWEKLVTKNGLGRAYGVEFMAHKQKGDWNGWFSYTWAVNERRFAAINSGQWYPHQYDRRHELSATGNYLLSEKWTAAANFVFATGNAFTAPSYLTINYADPSYTIPVVIYSGKNNRRGPNYHRLDISMVRKHQKKNGNEISWAFGVYNAYAHRNPFYIDVSLHTSFNADHQVIGKYFNYETGSVFNFIPSISYAVKFK